MKFMSIVTTAALLACLSPAAVSARDSIQFSTWIPPTHQIPRYLFTLWAEQVNTQADSTIKVKTEYGSSMVSPRGALAELADGIVDGSHHVAQYTPTELKMSNAMEELGMRYADPRVVIAAASDFNFNAPEMQAEWKRNNIVFGGSYVTAPYKLVCNRPIKTLADMKGAKLRLPGRAPAAWANSIGAVTMAFNSNEQYGALDKGALTCTTTNLADAHTRKLYEVAKHVTDLPITLFWAGYAWGYNRDTWLDLTTEQRRTLLDAKAAAIAAYAYQGLGIEESDAGDKLIEAGVQIHEPAADLVASIDAYRDNQLTTAAGVAKETFKIDNAEDLLNRFAATMAKWEQLVADLPEGDQDAYAALLRNELFGKLDPANYPAN